MTAVAPAQPPSPSMTGAAPSQMAAHDTQAARDLDIITVLIAAVLDSVLIALLVRQSIGYLLFLLGHLAIVAILVMRAGIRRRQAAADTTMLALATLATLSVGPFGGIGAILAVLAAPIRSGTTALLTAWYERIAHSVATDPVTQLCDLVSIGRSVDLGGPPPTSFCAVMSGGSLSERQSLLGLIARSFDIEYLPALKIALRSPEPVIRVQAAAVATKVQLSLARIVRSWAEFAANINTSQSSDPISALGGIVTLEACLHSGLIEAADRQLAERTRARLAALALAATDVPGFNQRLLATRNNPLQLSAIVAYEALLVRERRFKDLRNWRRLQRVGQLPRYRLRSRPGLKRSRNKSSIEVAA